MKLFKAIALLTIIPLTLLTALTACNPKAVSDYDKIHKSLMDMTAYSCDAEIKYISNNGENTYHTKQWATSDGKYKIETTSPENVKGGVIVFDGKMLWQYNPEVKQKVSLGSPDKPERTQINIFTFISNMVKSQNVGVESANLDESLCTVFEAEIPGDMKLFSSQKLWVDNKSGLPTRLTVFDKEGKERASVSFSNFVYNPKIEEGVFTIDK